MPESYDIVNDIYYSEDDLLLARSSNIREYFKSQLLPPLKNYPTVIQKTLLEIIIQKLEELYYYSIRFPRIISPSTNRLEVLAAITQQFVFQIRDEAKLQEQLDILEHILYIYRRRGSIDTIENMWRYYGGDLPKDVKVIIPAYSLFRYSVSKWSGTHIFPDATEHRTGAYEIRLTNNTYPVDKLKEFMLRELVAAGNYIYFTNSCHIDINSEDISTNPYYYDVYEDTVIFIQMSSIDSLNKGFAWSNPKSRFGLSNSDMMWSGHQLIYLEVTPTIDILLESSYLYDLIDDSIMIDRIPSISEVVYSILLLQHMFTKLELQTYCTPDNENTLINRYLYDSEDNLIYSRYPGYFILSDTLLGGEVI